MPFYHHDRSCVQQIAVDNGVPESSTALLDANEANLAGLSGSVDLVYSHMSWGFHYPVSTYADAAFTALKPGGIMLLSLRAGTYIKRLVRGKGGGAGGKVSYGAAPVQDQRQQAIRAGFVCAELLVPKKVKGRPAMSSWVPMLCTKPLTEADRAAFRAAGDGTAIFTGDKTFGGATSVTAGTLQLGDASALVTNYTSEITVAGGARPEITILKASQRIPWSGHSARYAAPDIYEELKRRRMTLIFVNTRSQAEIVFQELWSINDDNLPIALHHGSLDVGQRRKVEAAMAAGKLCAVVATSIFFKGSSMRTDTGILYLGITILALTLSCFAIYFPDAGGMLFAAGKLKYDPQIIKVPAGYRGADSMNYDDVNLNVNETPEVPEPIDVELKPKSAVTAA